MTNFYKYLFVFGFLLGCSMVSFKHASAAETVGFSLTSETETFTISKTELDTWRGSFTIPPHPLFTQSVDPKKAITSSYDPEKIFAWVKSISNKINTTAVDGSLTITNNVTSSFTPPQYGKTIDAFTTTHDIVRALMVGQTSTKAVIYQTKPKNDLSQSNSLGINELIGRGESKFSGSPNNRRHNIATGVEKLKGVIITPGAEFSFNENICPVEKSTGYLPELVIKADGTKPEYGGGLCQVSSTVFRAVMDAGLKVVQRKNHSYAVQYYAPQGTDATTYCGGVDFRFLNDTAGSVLIWPWFKDKDTLVFDLYGTKDDRQVVLEKPVQYDRKSDGSMKATWIRHVTKDGITNTDTFKSTYLPPALFHKEEKLDTPGQTPITPSPSNTTPPPPPVNL